jgi:hypothetical protein
MRNSTLLFFVAISVCACAGSTLDTDDTGKALLLDTVDITSTADIVFIQDNRESTSKDQVDSEVEEDESSLPDQQITEPGCEEGEGCFLDSCGGNSDCQSGWCVEHLGEAVCSKQCQEECPEGWVCQQVAASNPDVVFICVSEFANLCKPCANANDCDAIGMSDSCISYGVQGSFCGGSCADSSPGGAGECPWGFVCQEVESTDGFSSWQCLAEAGVCPCTKKSITLGLHTPCTLSNEWGECQGLRICQDEGLSSCDAMTPSVEQCNGIDDNCNGIVDEATCDDENECTQDICDVDTGCQHELLDVGECKDGDPCTVADHCVAGECLGSPVSCEDSNPCTDDTCTEGGCVYSPNQDDCDDVDPCTLGDVCKQGECVGVQVDCGCLTDADCDAVEDGDVCNGTLVCDTAQMPYKCVVNPATVVECLEPSGADAWCLESTCNTQTGECGFAASDDDKPCEDGDSCTVSEKCMAGECAGGTLLNCNDGNACTDDLCHPQSGCSHTPNAAGCDDGDDCTVGDVCSQSQCESGVALSCNDDNSCTDDSCQAAIGCVHEPNAAQCSDHNPCTTGDHCSAGKCAVSGSLDCNDGNACTDDACNPDVGCTHTINTAPCDDANTCTAGDKCGNGWCAGKYIDCNDNNPCTADSCDEQSGCVHEPANSACSDGSLCTIGDYCQQGTCIGAQELVCDDLDVCTDDSCIAELGCVHKLNNLVCDDGNPCTLDDQCTLGECLGGQALVCIDEVDCTVDSCAAEAGCEFIPNDMFCADGNPCTSDVCDPAVGCVHNLTEASCEDGDPCTVGDKCNLGACESGEFTDCNDGNQCTTDGCDPQAGCTHTPTAGNCDDADACTLSDHCELGECVGGPALHCEDVVDCTVDSCAPGSGCLFTPKHSLCEDANLCTADICDPQAGCSNDPVEGDCLGGHCEAGTCIVDCLPECDGKECGDDGCEGSCGDCLGDTKCVGGKCVLPGSNECDDGNDILWDGCTSGELSEFRVNTFTPGQQANPRVAAFSDSGYVVVWGSYDQDGSLWGVYGQRYQPDGSPQGSEFQVNSHTDSHQSTPFVAVTANDDFIVAWQSLNQDGSGYGIYARKFDQEGNQLWVEARLNDSTSSDQLNVSLAPDAGGGFVATWQHYNDGSGYGIMTRRFTADGNALASNSWANSFKSHHQERPSLVSLPGGKFLAFWDSDNQDGSSWGVYGQRFSAGGDPEGSDFRVNTYTPNTQYYNDSASFTDGSYVVAWTSADEDGNSWGIYAQRFQPDHSKAGNPFRVNTYIVANQYQPKVGSHPDGRFAVAWQSHGQDGADWGVYGQRYNKDGTPAGAEFQANVFTSYSQHQPDAAMLPNGVTVIVWTGNAQDDSVSGVFAQRWDEDGNKLYH